jgi:DNA-binding NarL/FixJ family response regulator
VAAAAALFAEGREMTADDAVGYALGSHIETAGGLPGAPAHAGAKEPGRPGEAAWADPARLAQVRSASPLTAREHEIVVLIARGLSNRQIADELVISPATAARHVANILAKLGFTSRTQVASWAARHEPSS